MWAKEASGTIAGVGVVRARRDGAGWTSRPTPTPLEDLVFHSKSRTEQLQDQSASLVSTAASVAEQLRERVVPAVGQVAESAMERVQPHVEAARLWAKPRVEHGIEVAAPRLESAVSGLAPKVDTARDKIVEELLPRLIEAITAFAAVSAAAKDEAVTRGTGAASILSGDATATPKRKKKGRLLLILGLLGAAAAGVATFMKKSAPKDDPWATPLADSYVAPSTGRHSSVAAVDETADLHDIADPLDDPAAADSEPASVESLDGSDASPAKGSSAAADHGKKDDKGSGA
ncbi:MAG: hypothetical protein ABI899_05195 [Actinomycetota bacterium]